MSLATDVPVTWVIVGATSAIAQAFAKIAAEFGHPLILVGRDVAELDIIAHDIVLRYAVPCDRYVVDLAQDISSFLEVISLRPESLALFIAASTIVLNEDLTHEAIGQLLQANVVNTTQLIHSYRKKPQPNHRLLFLSSVAAVRGRFKNSLYAGSKAAIEVYLEGVQQGTSHNLQDIITIARLGFIDTSQTYGLPGIFYASPPLECARACWKASYQGKRLVYHPSFWRYLMIMIRFLPFFLYRRLSDV